MTIREMKQRKRELGFSIAELSKRSGVPEATIQKLFSGTTRSPRKDTVEKLERVLVNPTTKQRMLVPPKMVVNFKPNTSLRSKIKNEEP